MAVRAAASRLPLLRPLHFPPPPISSPLIIPCSPRNLQHVFRCQVTTNSNPKLESVAQSKGGNQSSEDWKIKMLYDGDCPLCMREVNMLRERNERYKAIKFVDISSDDFSPAENQGLDYETVMGRIHAILSDGTVVRDVEAFRRLYEEVGLGWIYAITKYEPDLVLLSHHPDQDLDSYGENCMCILPSSQRWSSASILQQIAAIHMHKFQIATIADSVYGVWAKYRLQITGRPPLDNILEARKKKVGEACTDDKVCKM